MSSRTNRTPLRVVGRLMLLALPSLLLASCGQTGSSAAPAAAVAACDRRCLEGMVNRYLDALVAHDRSKIPTTADVRFVENDVALPLGSALWKTASGRGTYSHYFSDVAAGQAGFIGTMREHGKGIILVLRLAVAGGQIKEIEQLAIRTGNVDEYEQLKPDPLWIEAVPEASRSSRAELTALANRYYSGMQRNDPKGDYSFFHKGCNRIEHGRQTTNMPPSNYGHSDIPNFVTMGCEAQFQTGFLGFVTGIRDRRYPVIDEERQTVLAFAFFDHNGTIRSIPLSTGQIFKVPPYFSTPRELTIAEGFKVIDKKLRLIEATLTESPYGMTSVFNNPPPAPPRAPTTEGCDQRCAKSLVDALLAAMIAHDPAKAPLAPGVRYTENGQSLAVGEGMWRTLTARGTYNIYLAAAPGSDPAFFGSIVETDIPGQLSLRVRQQGGKISEIEALVVRQEIAMLGKLIGTGTLFAPPQLVDFDSTRFKSPMPVLAVPIGPVPRTSVGALSEIATAFAKAMYGKATAPPSTPTCIVKENGGSPGLTALSNPGTTASVVGVLHCARSAVDDGFFAKVGTLRKARVLAADEAQGLVLMSTVVDHPGDVSTVTGGKTVPVPPAFTVPNTYFRSMLLKIREGRIEHVEAITRPVFLGMDDGWDM
jgi:hypothetical protein